MVHDSDSNTAKTWFLHVKRGDQTLFFDPPLEKVGVGVNWPLWPRASAVYERCNLPSGVRGAALTQQHFCNILSPGNMVVSIAAIDGSISWTELQQ